MSAPLPGGRSGRLGEHAEVVHCPLESPMTLGGTNTWLLAAPDDDAVVVIDPGPDDERHLQAVRRAVGERTLALVLLTHHHWDHAAGAPRLAELTGAPVRAHDLADGEVVTAGALRVQVLCTPGHTSDSVCFVVPDARLLLTGDTVLGAGTTVLDHPDGRLGDYLLSLERLAGVVRERDLRLLGPGHGPVRTDPAEVLAGYLAHRQERLAQVRDALARLRPGGLSPDEELTVLAGEIVDLVYADTASAVRPAALRSVLAQLVHLAAGG